MRLTIAVRSGFAPTAAAARRRFRAACVCAAAFAPILAPGAQEQPATFDRPARQDVLQPAELSSEGVRRVLFELRLAEPEPVRGLTFEATVKSSGRKLYLHYAVVVSNGDISRARVVESTGRHEVAIRLTDDGALKLNSATARHVGRPVAIILDGGVIADLTVRSALGAELIFSGNFTQAEAARIVDGLNKW
jgi:preprotein translocase subunit SecD